MLINALPRCNIDKLPNFQNLPFLSNSDTTTIRFNGIYPSPNGAFKPINSTKFTPPTASLLARAEPEPSNIPSKVLGGKNKRRKYNEDEDATEERKAKRAERNRKFAKDSRDRKRKYIQDLEIEVKYLREQLEAYKRRLSKYELIEKHIGTPGFEMYNILRDSYKEMWDLKRSLNDSPTFIETLKRKLKGTLEELKYALVQLTKTMMTIIMPLPLRVSVWLSENQVDIYDSKEVHQKFGKKVPAEHLSAVINCLRMLYPNREQYHKIQADLAEIGRKIKSLMKQIIEFQKKLQSELISYGKHMSTHVLYYENPGFLEALAAINSYFSSNPELSDNVIYQVNDTDLEVTI